MRFLTKDPLSSFEEIFGNIIRPYLPPVPEVLPFSLPISREDQNPLGSNLMSKFDVHPPVSDHVTRRGIEMQFLRSLFDQSRCRLATSAFLPIRRNADIRMMGTVIDPVEMSSLFL